MKNYVLSLGQKFISPSMRFELREAIAWLQEFLCRISLWRWEIFRFKKNSNNLYSVLYAGRKSKKGLVQIHLKINSEIEENTRHGEDGISNSTVFVSEMYIPGALCVPWYLRAIVPLGRPIEAVTAEYDGELRRSIRKHRDRYRLHQALSDSEITSADREMLQPYAAARHGVSASQIATAEVRRLAQKSGRLDFVMLENEAVACHLGCTITRSGKRYWSTVRFGYTEAVFSDTKRLRETNSITTFLELEWAIENNFDYYDIGTCTGRPDDGLLQWKRRRGGMVDNMTNHGYFYVRLPGVGAAKFLWDTPLFSVERKGLTLHLGLPEEASEEEFTRRYREMGFSGLYKVYLYSGTQPEKSLLDALLGLYKNQKTPPALECITAR